MSTSSPAGAGPKGQRADRTDGGERARHAPLSVPSACTQIHHSDKPPPPGGDSRLPEIRSDWPVLIDWPLEAQGLCSGLEK